MLGDGRDRTRPTYLPNLAKKSHEITIGCRPLDYNRIWNSNSWLTCAPS